MKLIPTYGVPSQGFLGRECSETADHSPSLRMFCNLVVCSRPHRLGLLLHDTPWNQTPCLWLCNMCSVPLSYFQERSQIQIGPPKCTRNSSLPNWQEARKLGWRGCKWHQFTFKNKVCKDYVRHFSCQIEHLESFQKSITQPENETYLCSACFVLIKKMEGGLF